MNEENKKVRVLKIRLFILLFLMSKMQGTCRAGQSLFEIKYKEKNRKSELPESY
jgi:hypothetical protein